MILRLLYIWLAFYSLLYILHILLADIHGSEHHDTIFIKMTNKMQMCRIIYCSFAAIHVSSDFFAHHQEHLNCIYSFWYYSVMSLPAAVSKHQLRKVTNILFMKIILA
jgi:hypothetical protein